MVEKEKSFQGDSMDSSTDGVTLYAGFILDVVDHYRDRGLSVRELLAMTEDLDANDPTREVPISRYNDACEWIESKLGVASIRRAGVAIGDRVYAVFSQMGHISDEITPPEMMKVLKFAADTMIQDPKERGWDILPGKDDHSLVMRRTQTFNCLLQEGLLETLLRRSNARAPRIEHARCTRKGDAFCEYELSWFATS